MSQKWVIRITVLVLIAALSWQRYTLFQHFNAVYTDDDQTTMWLAATDLAQGNIHTPFFYGQNYNNMLVAWLCAIPIRLGLSVVDVFPIAANVVGVLPLIFVLLSFRKSGAHLLLLLTAFWLMLPSEFHLILSMGRGFAGGIVLLTAGWWLATYSDMWCKNIGIMLMLISPIMSKNVMMILAPLVLAQIIHQRKVWKTWTRYIPGVLLALVLAICISWYKQSTESQMVHHMWDMDLSFDYMRVGLEQLNVRLAYLAPFSPNGWLSLSVMLVLGLIFVVFKRDPRSWIVSFSVLFFILFSLVINKSADGTSNLFFPYTRLYVGVPISLMLAIGFGVPSRILKSKIAFVLILIGGMMGLGYLNHTIDDVVTTGIRESTGHVEITRIDNLCRECDNLEALRKRTHADVIVFIDKAAKYNYGCSALNHEMLTIHPGYDRRVWRTEELMKDTFPTVLWLDWSLQLDQHLIHHSGQVMEVDSTSFPAYLLVNNHQSLLEICRDNQLALPEILK
ncbi:MAG: hypothetical protein H6608_00535 [Flavobacteriales bacterium]|nr:hypothetical protein [Bacteroidota bacterium]MCB9239592.1 hypothetical protein [Flavobacteriales bacterium]